MILPLSSVDNTSISRKRITQQIIDCYQCPSLLGKFRIQPIQIDNIFHLILIIPHIKQPPVIQIHFPQNYPQQPLSIQFIHSATQQYPFYTTNKQNKLKQIIHQIYQSYINQSINNHQQIPPLFNQMQHCLTKSGKTIDTLKIDQENPSLNSSSLLQQNQHFLKSSIHSSKQVQRIQYKHQYKQKIKQKLKLQQKQRKPIKKTSITLSNDKQLTQTKNLNRHFRSKLREVYKDLMITEQVSQDSLYIEQVFAPNRVGFQDIRKALKNQWFNKAIKKQMDSGRFLNKILRGIMGVKSKKLMIKYYHVMASAVQNPQNFTRWKYQ